MRIQTVTNALGGKAKYLCLDVGEHKTMAVGWVCCMNGVRETFCINPRQGFDPNHGMVARSVTVSIWRLRIAFKKRTKYEVE